MNKTLSGFRIAAAVVVVLSWLTLVILMWRAFRTVPTPEQLADARHMRPPLPTDFYLNLGTSAAEAVALTALLWPWSARRYILRVVVALAALLAWFFASVPLDLNTMEWQHRRWLALMVVLLLVTLLVYPLLKRGTRETEG